MRKAIQLVRVVCVSLLITTNEANASLITAAVIDPVTASFSFVSNGTFGWVFKPTTDITVTKLGFFDFNDNGLAISHSVGVWDLSQNLVISTVVSSGIISPIESHFRFTSVSPTTLFSGESYIIGANNPLDNGDAFALNVGTIAVDPNITFLGARFVQQGSGNPSFGDTLNFPVNGFSANSYFGPNFQFEISTVPEPATLGLFGLGLAGMVASRFRKQRA